MPRTLFPELRMGPLFLLLTLALTITACEGPQDTGSGFELEETTIVEVQEALLTGQITTVELVESYLRRIQAYNGQCVEQPAGLLGPIVPIANAGQINALSTLNLRPAVREAWGFDRLKARSLTDPTDEAPEMPDALEVATAQDLHFGQTGELAGPLHGVVMAIKDQYDTFDMRTTSGADVDYADDRPPDDATFVQRLRDAGAIILAKANLAEYASDGARSAFGGTFCNPYDTEREPGMSSAGSATAVAANLVTCAIGEETVVSIRWPAAVNNLVGLAPTQELVSRDGMIGAGLNMRTGPMCRNVEDTARIFDAIAGYDPKDELTVFSVGRMPDRPYAEAATAERLDGVRIGVVREYMDTTLFSTADAESIQIVERALADLESIGATIVDPGPGGDLFQACIDRYAPQYYNQALTRAYPETLSRGRRRRTGGGPYRDPAWTWAGNRNALPDGWNLRNLGRFGAVGEGRYMMNRYLLERGDANIRSQADLIERGVFYEDSNFPDRRAILERSAGAMVLDTSLRLQNRFALRLIVMQCMQEQSTRRSGVPDRQRAAAQADRPAGTHGERPLTGRLVASGTGGVSGNHGTGGFHHGGMGSRARRRWRNAPGRTDSGQSSGRHRFPGAPVRRAHALSDRVRLRDGNAASDAAARFRAADPRTVGSTSLPFRLGCRNTLRCGASWELGAIDCTVPEYGCTSPASPVAGNPSPPIPTVGAVYDCTIRKFLIRAVIDRPYSSERSTTARSGPTVRSAGPSPTPAPTPTPTVGAVYDCTILILDSGGHRPPLVSFIRT